MALHGVGIVFGLVNFFVQDVFLKDSYSFYMIHMLFVMFTLGSLNRLLRFRCVFLFIFRAFSGSFCCVFVFFLMLCIFYWHG